MPTVRLRDASQYPEPVRKMLELVQAMIHPPRRASWGSAAR